MMGLLHLTLGACALWAFQQLSRHASLKAGLFSCEMFVLANWAFVFLHGVVLYLTGGRDWGALNNFRPVHIWVASGVVALGLLSYVAGAWIGAATWLRNGDRGIPSSIASLEESPIPFERGLVGVLGFCLALVGGLASTIDASTAVSQGNDARSNALIIISQLVVPGGVFCAYLALSRKSSFIVRLFFGILLLGTLAASLGQFTRRPLVIILACALCMIPFTRAGFIKRRLIFLSVPVLWLVAAVLLVTRRILFSHAWTGTASLTDFFSFYLDKVWIETSSFGGLIYIVKNFGLTKFLGGESFFALFTLWIPRSLYPSKPSGFDLVAFMDRPYPYNLPPTLYGELLINFTVAGIVPALFLLGFFLKRIDLRIVNSRSIISRLVYFMFLFDLVFLLRGSFTPMMFPLLLHTLVPLAGLAVWKSVVAPRREYPGVSPEVET